MEKTDTKELAKIVYDALDEKKAIDIKIIDIQKISVIADYFIVASANNTSQLQALQDIVDEKMYKNGYQTGHIEGNRDSTWILMDYEDIIVHLFSEEDRLFYNLERIWKDGVFLSREEL